MKELQKYSFFCLSDLRTVANFAANHIGRKEETDVGLRNNIRKYSEIEVGTILNSMLD